MNWINEKPIECVGKVSPTNGFNYDRYYNSSLLGSNRKPLIEQIFNMWISNFTWILLFKIYLHIGVIFTIGKRIVVLLRAYWNLIKFYGGVSDQLDNSDVIN